jgi:hypothetical protein
MSEYESKHDNPFTDIDEDTVVVNTTSLMKLENSIQELRGKLARKRVYAEDLTNAEYRVSMVLEFARKHHTSVTTSYTVDDLNEIATKIVAAKSAITLLIEDIKTQSESFELGRELDNANTLMAIDEDEWVNL